MPEFILSHPFWGWMAVGAVFLPDIRRPVSRQITELALVAGRLIVAAMDAWSSNPARYKIWTRPVAVAVFGVLTIITTYVGRRYLVGHGADAAT